MERDSIIRTIYLYTFSLIGLVLVTIGGTQFLDLALKASIFKKADDEQRIFARQMPTPAMRPEMERWSADSTLTDAERARLREWLEEYENWKTSTAKLDPVSAQRQRTASTSLSLILVGLPLYFFHWRLIRKSWRA
jgi:hypothetical protein